MFLRTLLPALGCAAGLGLAAGQPRLVVDPPSYDFGTITPDHPVTHGFRITNAGDADLTLGNPYVHCGCTTYMLGTRVLPPGESTWLELTFTPDGRRGRVAQSLLLLSDDPLAPERTLDYQARVLGAVQPSREDVYFHGLGGAGWSRDSITLEAEAGPVRLALPPRSPVPWLAVATRPEAGRLRVAFSLDARRLPADRRSGTETVPLLVATAVPTVVRIQVHWEAGAPAGPGSPPAAARAALNLPRPALPARGPNREP